LFSVGHSNEQQRTSAEPEKRWHAIFPRNLDITLGWTAEMDLTLLKVDDEVGPHVLVSESGPVRGISTDEYWSVPEVKGSE
jgi:hypothetical protein